MKENSISYLNSKTWYRALKVFYIFIFIISVVGANIFAFEDGVKSINSNKTIIRCNGGEKKVFNAKDANITFDSSDFKNGFNYKNYFEGYNSYNIEKILQYCYDDFSKQSSQDIYIIQRVYEIVGLKNNKKDYDKEYLQKQVNEMSSGYKTDLQKSKYLDYSIHLFDIEPAFSYSEFIKNFLLSNLIIIILFEIFRRAFYYIVLGKIRPKK